MGKKKNGGECLANIRFEIPGLKRKGLEITYVQCCSTQNSVPILITLQARFLK